MGYRISTKCIYGDREDTYHQERGSLSFPIYQSATFAHEQIGEDMGYSYSRMQNPTREQLEKIVSTLENGVDCLAFTSGMAAITAVMEIFQPGDHIISDCNLYGGTLRLFEIINKKNQLSFDHVNCTENVIEDKIKENTKAIFIETPTNPMMHVIDIRKIVEIAKKHNLLVIVDNTFLSPYFQNPLDLGVDIVVHSGTKYLCGHNDTLAGFLVTSSKEIAEQLRIISKTTGAGLSPFDSWLLIRGIKTLAIRMECAQDNALKIAKWLKTEGKVTKVCYPGLEDDSGHLLCKSQARGFGAMITFEVESKELALHIIHHIKTISFAESLGGVESLITYPITQTHADVSAEVLEANGITDKILRLSVGIEDVQDLIEALEKVFHSQQCEIK